MAKLKTDPIGESDLTEYLESTSDFAFEIKCLKELRRIGYQAQHGGTYFDPITRKPRQFDIRARKSGRAQQVLLAVECKNLKPWFPLLVMCTPRSSQESFHEIVVSEPLQSDAMKAFVAGGDPTTFHTHRAGVNDSVYARNKPVGRSVAQVGRDEKTFVSNDAEVYDKWSQAIASSHNLEEEAIRAAQSNHRTYYTIVLPVLVVPDGTLWQVAFDENGDVAECPNVAKHCSYLVNYRLPFGTTLSHLEIITFSGLESRLKELLNPDFSTHEEWFPANAK